MLFLDQNMETLKKQCIKHFLFHSGIHQNVFPVKFRVTFTLMLSSDLDRNDADNLIWSFFHLLDFLATLTV